MIHDSTSPHRCQQRRLHFHFLPRGGARNALFDAVLASFLLLSIPLTAYARHGGVARPGAAWRFAVSTRPYGLPDRARLQHEFIGLPVDVFIPRA